LPTDIQAEILAFDRVAGHEERKEKYDLLNELIKALPK
jgi:hypothetical protein